MKYRAQITLDWGKPDSPNDQQAIIAALVAAGWCLAETTALIIETDDLGRIWQGIEIVAKGASAAGPRTVTVLQSPGQPLERTGQSDRAAISETKVSNLANKPMQRAAVGRR